MARCKNKYMLPMRKKDFTSWSKRKSPAHVDDLKHSIDFECPENTPIFAALGGTVVWLRNDSNEGGPHKKYWLKGNRIVIKHKNGEYTAYEHLKYKGAVVKVGDKVKKGQMIGYSGNTGFSFSPHLHFEIFNNPDKEESEGITLQVFFSELSG
ncbi:M23 family metallopeptidase [Nanoarchaeota archaeon]